MKRERGRGARSSAKVRFEIPSDRAVPLAVNRGNPAVALRRRRRDFSRGVRDDGEGPARPRRGQAEEALARPLGEGVERWASTIASREPANGTAPAAAATAPPRRSSERAGPADADGPSTRTPS